MTVARWIAVVLFLMFGGLLCLVSVLIFFEAENRVAARYVPEPSAAWTLVVDGVHPKLYEGIHGSGSLAQVHPEVYQEFFRNALLGQIGLGVLFMLFGGFLAMRGRKMME